MQKIRKRKTAGNLENLGGFSGTPGAIRTHGLQSRRLVIIAAFYTDNTTGNGVQESRCIVVCMVSSLFSTKLRLSSVRRSVTWS